MDGLSNGKSQSKMDDLELPPYSGSQDPSRFNNPKAAPRSSWPPSPIDRNFHELQRVPVRHVEVVDWWMDFGLVWT